MIVKNKYIIIISAVVIGLGIAAFLMQHNRTLGENGTIQKSSVTNGQGINNNIAAQNDNKEIALAESSSKIAEIKKTPEIITYTVKPGDTLSSISKGYGISVNTIAESNKLNVSSILKNDQKLTFPSVNGVLYGVKAGENLWDIANSYNISVSSIVDVNSLGAPDKIKIGQILILPGANKIITANADSNVISKNSTVVKTASKAKISFKAPQPSRGGRISPSLGSIIWPVKGPITSGFGNRGNEFHTGIDIGVPSGTHVKAALGGVVAFAGWDGGYGNLVILDNSNGVKTYYAHNSQLLVKVGQAISQGEVISISGSTGRSTGPHVHFEIRINNKIVSPFQYLR
jgi:murein DD-endopeptidase MepM/ murein hydrolase activator NlpD